MKKRLRHSLRVPKIKKLETLTKMCGFLISGRRVFIERDFDAVLVVMVICAGEAISAVFDWTCRKL